MEYKNFDEKIIEALKEDNAFDDITTNNIFSDKDICYGELIAKEDCIIAGLSIFERVFKLLSNDIEVETLYKDGCVVKKGSKVAHIQGKTKSILIGERTALNFIQRLSGIATKTKKYCEKVKDYPVRITDTRKTTPGLRMIEKYAVRVGGGCNHRFTLADGVLIKDNHISSCGSIKLAIDKVKKVIPHTTKVEVETSNLEQVKEALLAGADIIMLDNMSKEKMKEAVDIINGNVLVEASGNINLENVEEVAKTGVDIISVGSLTHSVKSIDLSLKFT